jgi:hypothetical protein
MKYLITVVFLCLIATSSFGVVTQCPDQLGIYFDQTADNNCLTVGPSIPFSAYVILVNPTAPSINAFEFGFQNVVPAGMESLIFMLSSTITNDGGGYVDVGDHTHLGGDYIVGLANPIPAQSALTLVSWQYMLLADFPVEMYLGASSKPSIPGDLPVVQDATNHVLMQVDISSGDPNIPVATVNTVCYPIETCFDPLDMSVTIAFEGDGNNTAGTSQSATDGFDDLYDFIDTDMRLTFPHPEWGNPAGDNYRSDIKASYDPTQEIKQWSFVTTATSYQSMGQSVTVNFDPSFFTPAPHGFRLQDNQTGGIINLNTTLSYSFWVPEGTTTRSFDLFIGSDSTGSDEFFVDVLASTNGYTDMEIRAGTLGGATDGYDSGIDIQKPGPAPSNYVTTSFHHPEWPVGPRFQSDIREIYDPTMSNKVWPLVLETDQSGSITLVFSPSFTAADNYDLYLKDLQTGQTFNLFPSLSYVFSNNGIGTYNFELMVGVTLPPDLSPTSRYIESGWTMIGMPLIPFASSETFNDVILNQATGFALPFEYLGSNGYLTLAGGDTPLLGTGYWIAADSGFNWTMNGEMDLDGVEIPMTEGWNMIGNPMWFPGPFEGIHVLFGNSDYPWQTAIDLGLVSTGVLTYSNNNGQYYNAIDLQAWNGYWINALQPDVSLWFDWQNFQVLPSRLTTQKSGIPIADFSWETTLTLVDSDRQRKSIVMGVHPEATKDFDPPFDMPMPPSSPNGGTRFAFARPEWDLMAGDYFIRDIQPESQDPLTWNAVITTTSPGKVVLSWDGSDWPEGMDYQIYLPEENRVVVMSMREQINVHFETEGGSFPIVIRTPNMISGVEDMPGMNYEVGVHPNPFNPMTTIHFDLPQPAVAEIRIFSVRGELYSVLGGEHYQAGRQEVIWNGRDRHGRNAASGSYFARLYVDGRAIGSVTKMSLVR